MIDYLLHETLVRAAFWILAAATLLIGAALAWRRRRRGGSPDGAVVALLAFSGPAILLAWGAYNSVTAVFGLDSLAGLLVNLSLFSMVGILAGLAWRRRRPSQDERRP